MHEAYDVQGIQEKWLPVWDELEPFKSGRPGDARPKKYVLDMFPYPSGDLHMGHAEAYALGDVIARYWIQKGFNVMHPIGWDSFGLPAENAAIKRGTDPRAWTYENIAVQKASMRRYACSFDWDRIVHTSDPEYYKWNQWLFLEMYKKGLAYRKDSAVNWCPKDQTVLANEQVVAGLCERCDTPVTKKKLNQWYLKITDYADRLLDDMKSLEGAWPEKVLMMQRNWIGRSQGAEVTFKIEGRAEPITIYTTRPDTLRKPKLQVISIVWRLIVPRPVCSSSVMRSIQSTARNFRSGFLIMCWLTMELAPSWQFLHTINAIWTLLELLICQFALL